MIQVRYILQTCLFLVISTMAVAQPVSGELIGADSVQKVMIIPFNQYNYFSDAGNELAEKNEMSATDISTMFRYGLNYNISTRVIATDGAYNILTDTTVSSAKDLELIYASVTYQFEKPVDVTVPDTLTDRTIKQPDLFGMGEQEPVKEEKKKLIDVKKDDEEPKNEKYLNAHVTHPEIFPVLQQKYHTDIFLFINSFELVTNYNHCLDRSKNYFERKVVVHYSIYDANGKQLKGDAMTVTFSSQQTNVDEIIATQFPVIAEYLAGTVTHVAQTDAPDTSTKK